MSHKYLPRYVQLDEKTYDEWDEMYLKFFEKKIDSASYYKYNDRMIAGIKDSVKCEFYLDNQLGWNNRGLDTSTLDDMKALIDLRRVNDWLDTERNYILESIKSSEALLVDSLQVDYIKLMPENQIPKRHAFNPPIFKFSRTCFNPTKTRAVLYYEFYCGTKCGDGTIAWFEKIDGRWRLIRQEDVWES